MHCVLKSVLIHRIEKEESERARELGKAPRLASSARELLSSAQSLSKRKRERLTQSFWRPATRTTKDRARLEQDQTG